MKKLLFTAAFFAVAHVQAQEIALRGTVVNTQNVPLEGVVIYSTNNDYTTVQTDANGGFTLRMKPEENYTVTAYYEGYETQVFSLTPSDVAKPLQVVLQEAQNSLEEVVIVSNRDKETRADVPASISVLTSKQIEKISQYTTSLSDVMAWIPGMSLSNNRQSNRGQKLRGGNMLVLIDGIPQSTPLFIDDNLNYLDPSAIERIEVIKGATSIYGNGAQGGIVNFITKKGATTKKIASQTKVGGSSFLVDPDHTAGVNLSQFFNGQLGKLNYNIGGSYKQYGVSKSAKGEILSPQDGMGESEWYNVFAKFGYDLGNDYNLELMYNYFSNQQESQLVHVPGKYGSETATGVFGERNPLLKGQGVQYNHNARLTLDKTDFFKNTDLTATYYWQKYATLYASFDYFTDVSKGLIGGQNYTKSDQMGVRVNFNTRYTLSDHVDGNLIYGVDILKNKTSQPMADGRIYTPEMDMKNYAAYLQIKTKVDDFIFKAGTRAEHIAIDVDDYTTIYRDNGTVTGGGLPIDGGKLSFNALTFNAAVRYNKLRFLQPYFSFSQSFSVGELGKALRIATDPTIITGELQDTKAIITDSYELGIEGRLSNKIRYGANYFIYKQKLGTTYVMNPETKFFELSRLPEKIQGAEFEVDVILSNKIDFNASLAMIEGKTDNNGNGSFDDKEDEYMDGARISPTILRLGFNYAITPKWNMNLSGTYTGNRNRFDKLADGTYAYGRGAVKSYFVANMFTSYQLNPSTSLSVGIENLLNNDYYPAFSQWYGDNNFYIKGNGINCKVALTVSL